MTDRKQVVLLVDDDNNVIHGYARNFRKSEFKIYTAKSAEEAMDILKRTTIDVIVSDEYMKAMKGTELLDWVEKFFPDTLRIILTGAPNSDSIEAALEANVYEYLTKPTDSETLHDIISQALASRV